MPSTMNFVICVLLFAHLAIPLCFALGNVGEETDQDDFKGIQLGATSTASSSDLRSDLNNLKTSTHIPVLKKHLSVNTNNSENHMSRILSARQAGIIWKRIHEALLEKLSGHELKNHTVEFSDEKRLQNSSIPESLASYEIIPSPEKSNSNENKVQASGRQFLFHPSRFFPYGKEIMPDEKISFHDVLPVKMVKFIKGMVEEAPWDQMFMKMVRMIVDQFVDKIIEKMFSHSEEDDGKWRSLDGEWSTGNHPQHSKTSVVRLRRAAVRNKLDKEDDWSSSGFQTENRLSKVDQHKEKGTSEEESWLDSILDYIFPNDTKSDSAEDSVKTRRKRDIETAEANESLEMPDILNTFFVKLYELQTGEVASKELKSTLKTAVHDQLLSSVFRFHSMFKSNSTELDGTVTSENPRNSSNLPSGSPERWRNILEPKPQADSGSPANNVRYRRSAMHSEEKEDSKRLWQANRRSRPMNFKSRGECSLRRACNTGRLLARLPSVKDITLQLKSYGNEPHWDALVWGMAKKKCSKIFCKRLRSPKGSKHHWDMEERRHYMNTIPSTASPRFKYDESDPASVSSLLQLYE